MKMCQQKSKYTPRYTRKPGTPTCTPKPLSHRKSNKKEKLPVKKLLFSIDTYFFLTFKHFKALRKYTHFSRRSNVL